MYKYIELASEPSDKSSKLWRYMDITKFLSMLETSCLYFTRGDKFKDPFEGSLPKPTREFLSKTIPEMMKTEGVIEEAIQSFKQMDFLTPVIHKETRKHIAINCWHVNDHESAAMWEIYSKINQGLAIQTTYERLKNSMVDNEDVYISLVKYLDYDYEGFKSTHPLNLFLHKRLSFKHEDELRCIVWKQPFKDSGPSVRVEEYLNYEPIKHGLEIRVDISMLIEKIFVAPDTPKWIYNLIKAVGDRYELNVPVVRSRINEDPIY